MNPRDARRTRRVARAFDLVGITDAKGAPSFALFAKGGYHDRLQRRSHATRLCQCYRSVELGTSEPVPDNSYHRPS
jgi:hypothetical protein